MKYPSLGPLSFPLACSLQISFLQREYDNKHSIICKSVSISFIH